MAHRDVSLLRTALAAIEAIADINGRIASATCAAVIDLGVGSKDWNSAEHGSVAASGI
jgi:hypothetical protein